MPRVSLLLAIDTTTRNASVALAEGERVIALRAWRSSVNHSTELMPAVAHVLEARGCRPADLDAVAVALGPGGFSALRTGMSAAKGLCFAAGKPIVGIGSLDLETYPYRDSGLLVCGLLEAGRGEAASALIGPGGSRKRDDRITGPDELLDEIEAAGDAAGLFCGEGLPAWAEQVKARLSGRAILCDTHPSSRACSLAALARRRIEAGDTDDLDALQPEYLRMPSIGEPKRRDRTQQASSRRRGRRSRNS